MAKHGQPDAFIIHMGTPPYEPFDEAFFAPLLPQCRIIASASAGYNEFPVDWLTSQSVWFCNTVDAVAESTANMTILLMLSVIRDAYRAERGARTGTWKQGVSPSRDPAGMTLGIVGMGAIGQYVAKKALAFNMKIRYHSRSRLSPEAEAQLGAVFHGDLASLLTHSDVVSLHCPLMPETTNLMSHAQVAAMKPGSFLVNTSRGPVLDEDALVEALESGQICRAGLDVFCNEPNIRQYFRTSDRVICQPHMGGLTDVAFAKAEKECFENVRSLFATGKPISPVNNVT